MQKKFILIASLSLYSILSLAQLPKGYQAQTALEKQALIFSKIESVPYPVLPETKTGFGVSFMLSSLSSLYSLNVSFDRASDEMPIARRKIIHPFGATAQIKWMPYKNKYSGVFQSGGVGLARLSIAGDPSLLGFTPGMAIKIFIDNNPSVNLQVMHSLDGQGTDQNFFKSSFTNNIEKPKSIILQPLVLLFSLVQNPPTYLPVDHFAVLNKKGEPSSEVVAPFSIVFVPTADVKTKYLDSEPGDFRNRLMALPQDIQLYDIYAYETSDSEPELIGKIKLESKFVASFYQDQKLFFQHNRTQK